MPHFQTPFTGAGPASAYEINNADAPGSVWKVTVPIGSALDISLYNPGADLEVSSNNPGVIATEPDRTLKQVREEASPGGRCRIFALRGQRIDYTLLDAHPVGRPNEVWCKLQVHVVEDPKILSDPRFTAAFNLIDEFSKKTTKGAFPYLHREAIAAGLTARVAHPTFINQGHVGVCAPAAVVYSIARNKPEDYVKAVTELFDLGRTKIDKWNITPGHDLKSYKLPPSRPIDEVDWIVMASIRDSENWFFDYESISDAGGAHLNEVTDWLTKAGFTDPQQDWNYVMDKPPSNLQKADELYSKGYQVVLRIDSKILIGETRTISRGDHVVVLASRVETDFSSSFSPVSMAVYTWGGLAKLPKETMSLELFTDYYYGYAAAHPS
jgi:hypothetical protein